MLKQLVHRALPGPYSQLRGVAWRRREKRRQALAAEVRRALIARHGAVVLSGPFAGMRYLDDCPGGGPTRLLGCYEEELHGAIETIVARGYERIVDVGSAEGYYAVGLARRIPGCTLLAFECDPVWHERCLEMARMNGVADRIVVGGMCDLATLANLPLKDALLMVDVEGFERDLLVPDAVPGLRDCDIMVELHECFSPGVTEAVLSRFAGTHTAQVFDIQPRDPSRYPDTALLPARLRRAAVDELRGGLTRWAFLTRRANGER